MAGHQYWFVRACVAGNKSTPTRVLERMAREGDHDVRVAVSKNPAASRAALLTLARDDSDEVRRNVALNASVFPEALEVLAKDDDWVTRCRACESPGLSRSVLGALAGDEDLRVRAVAAPLAATAISEALGVDPLNEAARSSLLEQAWWEMTPESPEVALSLALFPNP